MKKAKQPLQAFKAMEEKLETFEEKVEAPIERRQESQLSVISDQSGVKLGEKVLIASLKAEGVVTALGESDAEVQIGSLRVRAKLSDLQKKVKETEVQKKDAKIVNLKYPSGTMSEIANQESSVAARQSPGIELNLRGKLVEDGLEEMERYLEKAYSAGLLFVRIIHGKGTGRMREAVRDALKSSSYVSSFEEPKDAEGGAGVTVAMIAK
ncbi:MAG: Smr/MutS family protein [Anaerolineales bacterium]|nr:Smr/MutS family protein [Anaerolineales bacterium]